MENKMNTEILTCKKDISVKNSCFDLARTLDCGQAFRWVQTGKNEWHGVAFGKPLTLVQAGDEIIFKDTGTEDFEKIWKPYFDLDRDYGALCKRFSADPHLKKAVALTSTISMHEIATAFIRENYKCSRQKSAVIVTLICIVLGTACSLSFGPWADIKIWGMGFFDLFDFLTAKFIMPLGGILITMFVEWYLDRKLVVDELTNGGAVRVRGLRFLLFLIRWVAPIGVGIVFLNELAG